MQQQLGNRAQFGESAMLGFETSLAVNEVHFERQSQIAQGVALKGGSQISLLDLIKLRVKSVLSGFDVNA